MRLWIEYQTEWGAPEYALLDIDECVGEYTNLDYGEFDYSEGMIDELIWRWLGSRSMAVRPNEYKWTFIPQPPEIYFHRQVVDTEMELIRVMQKLETAKANYVTYCGGQI